MKYIPLFAVAATLAFAAGARADDPPTPPVNPAKPEPPPAPTKAKHENKVTDEAKALFEKLTKTVNGPLHRGMKEASGTLATQNQMGATTMKFVVKAPGVVTVEAPAEGGEKGGGEKGGGGRGRGGMGARGGTAAAENLLAYAYGILRPAEDAEFDAEVVKKDGKEVLALTRFKDGAQTERREIAVDANGLVASAVLTRQLHGPDGQTRDIKSEVAYTWTKNGDSYRLDKYETKGERNSATVEITYDDAGGYSIPVAWKITAMGNSMETKISDIVVDGKKVEAPKKADAAEPKKPEEKGADEPKK